MLNRFEIQIDVVLSGLILRVICDHGPVPIEIQSNAKVKISSFRVWKEAFK